MMNGYSEMSEFRERQMRNQHTQEFMNLNKVKDECFDTNSSFNGIGEEKSLKDDHKEIKCI